MLQSSYTVNVGSPAADVVFDISARANGESVYYAASPNGDLGGRVKLRVAHQRTESGLVRSVLQIQEPIQNTDTGKYDSYRQVTVQLTRPETDALTDVDRLLEMIQEIWAVSGLRADFGNAEN
jgi:hypothetical protein